MTKLGYIKNAYSVIFYIISRKDILWYLGISGLCSDNNAIKLNKVLVNVM